MKLFPLFINTIFTVVLTTATAQNSIEEFVGSTNKIFYENLIVKSIIKEQFKAAAKNKEITIDLLMPKKIGLLTLYTFEENYRRRKSHLTYIYSPKGQLNYIIENISKNALKGVQKAFDGSGIELITSEKYLDNEVKKSAYNDAMKNINGLSDPFLKTLQDYDLKPTGSDFEFVYAFIEEGTNGYVADEIATLTKKLELDAMLTVQVSSYYETYDISISSVELILHGVDQRGDEMEQGLVLSSYSLMMPFPFPFISIKAAKIQIENFEAFDPMLERVCGDMLERLVSEIESIF